MININVASLTFFVVSNFINLSALVVDYCLIKTQVLPSITEVSKSYPLITVAIISFEILIPVSLLLHFIF